MSLKDIVKRISKILAVFALLYLFLVSISLLSASFKIFGEDFANRLIETTSNPFVGLFIGILATSIIQSSSTTTSMIVGFVASGALTIENAIPMVMGANIGTTVTNTLVAMAHITRKEEFKRAMSCSSIHDLFNLFTVLLLFPLELATGFLGRTAGILASSFGHFGGIKVMSPLKAAIKPVVHFVKELFTKTFALSHTAAGTMMLVLALALLFVALFLIVKIMKSSTAKRSEIIFDKILGRRGVIGIFMGIIFTAIVQSSSVTTSILVPIVASGITTIETIMPITMGANLGTTVTAMLAALTGNLAGITIAFVHFLFNLIGVVVVYNISAIRGFILQTAKRIAEACTERRVLAIVYVVSIFYLVPISLIWLSRFFN